MLILAVDDDVDDLELFCDAVREVDPSIKLISACNGEEALNFLQRETIAFPDFVFLDINMPRLNGRDCLRAIRNDKSTRHLPVIIYSTSLSEADKRLFKELNAEVMIKSACYSEIIASLKRIMTQLRERHREPISLIR